ncbi:Rid family hydrolase [Roseibium sp. M-1]
MNTEEREHSSKALVKRRQALTMIGIGAAVSSVASVLSPNAARAAGRTKRVERFGVPWEDSYGYVQALQVDDTIYLSGQLSHDLQGGFVAPAKLDSEGRVVDFSNMGAQLAQTYDNCKTLLSRFGATLDDAVEEVVYVLDMDSAFAAIPDVRRAAWGKTPVIASTILATPRLALPPQLCEIKMVARV